MQWRNSESVTQTREKKRIGRFKGQRKAMMFQLVEGILTQKMKDFGWVAYDQKGWREQERWVVRGVPKRSAGLVFDLPAVHRVLLYSAARCPPAVPRA